jgi:hypothetical protein
LAAGAGIFVLEVWEETFTATLNDFCSRASCQLVASSNRHGFPVDRRYFAVKQLVMTLDDIQNLGDDLVWSIPANTDEREDHAGAVGTGRAGHVDGLDILERGDGPTFVDEVDF